MRGNRSNRSSRTPGLTPNLSSEDFTVRIYSKRFRCPLCKKYFSSKHCLREHSYKHSNLRPYNCSICSEEFRHASQFTLHKQSHKSITKFVCPRLEELEKRTLQESTSNEEIKKKFELPLICEPSFCSLPLFHSIFPLSL